MEEKRQALILLAQKKEISYTISKLRKMSDDEILHIYETYEKEKREKELEDLNESVSDLVISKFDEFMKRYGWIEESSDMGKRLQQRHLFVADVKYFVSYVTPFIPFVGLLDGGLVIAEEMFFSSSKKNKNNGYASCQTEKGGEQDSTSASYEDDNESCED